MQKLESGNEDCKGRNALAPRPFERAVRRARKEKGKDEDDFKKIIIFANIKSDLYKF